MDNEKPKIVVIDGIYSHSMTDIIKILKEKEYQVEVISKEDITQSQHKSELKEFNISELLPKNLDLHHDRLWYQSKKPLKPKY